MNKHTQIREQKANTMPVRQWYTGTAYGAPFQGTAEDVG